MTPASQVPLTQYRAERIAVIRQIHAQMIENMAQRFTIEALARQYLMNPTTLKEVFKSVYGTSIAAHIKEHRMQRAAELLQIDIPKPGGDRPGRRLQQPGQIHRRLQSLLSSPPQGF